MIGNLKSNIASAFTKDIDNSIELEQPHKIEINLSKK